MNRDRKTQEELAVDVERLAQAAENNHRMGESYIIHSNARLIQSNARVEGAVGNLINQIKKFNEKSEKQTNKLVNLTWVIAGLTLLMLVGLMIQIRLRK